VQISEQLSPKARTPTHWMPSSNQILTQNDHSGSFKVIRFGVNEEPLRGNIYIIKGVMSVYLFICLSVICMLPMTGRTAGPIKTKLGIGTHVDPGSVLVKVKVNVIYLSVRHNRIHDSDTWRTTMNHACVSISSSSSAVAGATW